MNDSFQKKLEAYENGELSGKDLEEFEHELKKLETLQTFLEKDDTDNIFLDQKEKQIIRKGKWRARIQTTFFVFLLFIGFTFISSILTSVYYAWGNPDRAEVLRNVVEHTLTITEPYGYLSGVNMNRGGLYFNMELSTPIKKQVGDEIFEVGEDQSHFFFSLLRRQEEERYRANSTTIPSFFYPDSGTTVISDWNQLEKLPEGTVTSAYVSFSNLMETEEVMKLFSGKNIDLLWLAVDLGAENVDKQAEGAIFETIGFPSFPIWHDDDMILHDRKEEKGSFGSSTISESYSSPSYQEGDYDVLHQQFIKTLKFLQGHENIASKVITGDLELENKISYLEEEGIKHYGVVITGPTKEILSLEEINAIAVLQIDEARLWNWMSRE
ncbi:anti-sigma factor [Gracilibacillus lacisalsi]|uniref:anti-sigma factor n=1 Tax=Gracilibacillus lacisalsi TaxID=393087 RepID=UPI0003759D96|nr:anti-sigma factor [Gracilibacillus lacisalsi]